MSIVHLIDELFDLSAGAPNAGVLRTKLQFLRTQAEALEAETAKLKSKSKVKILTDENHQLKSKLDDCEAMCREYVNQISQMHLREDDRDQT